MRLLYLSLLLLYCSNSQENLQKKKLDNDYKTLFFLSVVRSSGECLRIETKNSSSVYTCTKYNSGLCSYNLVVLTQGEKNKNLSDTSTLVNKRPECKESLLSSGLLTSEVTKDTDIDSLKKNNIFTSVPSCNFSFFNNYDKLVTLSELQFIDSSRGQIGKVAYENSLINSKIPTLVNLKNNALECLKNEFTDAEKDILKQVFEKSKYKELSCTKNSDSDTCGQGIF